MGPHQFATFILYKIKFGSCIDPEDEATTIEAYVCTNLGCDIFCHLDIVQISDYHITRELIPSASDLGPSCWLLLVQYPYPQNTLETPW